MLTLHRYTERYALDLALCRCLAKKSLLVNPKLYLDPKEPTFLGFLIMIS